MCQRVSQSDSKWPRKAVTNKQTNKQTHRHFRIYISRDCFSNNLIVVWYLWHQCTSKEAAILYLRHQRFYWSDPNVISTDINTKMSVCLFVCLFVCLSVHVFLGHFKTDWNSLWHKVAFYSWEWSKAILVFKIWFFTELLPLFYISLRFLCNFEEELSKNQWR